MSDLPPLKKLQKMTAEELAVLGLRIDAQGKIRNTKGHYIPGQSGRLPAPKKAAPAASNEKSELIPAEIRKKYGDNPLQCMQEMLKLAATKADAVRISKELLPYTHPKLASVEQKTYNFHAGSIEVQWQDDNGEYISNEVIEHESGRDTEEMLPRDTQDN